VLSFDLSGKGGPTSSYATAGIALWIIAPRKPPYPAKDAFSLKCKGKGNAIPLQAWTGPEGSRRLRPPDFKTIGT